MAPPNMVADQNRASGTIADISFAGATTVALINLEGSEGVVPARIKIASRVEGVALSVEQRIAIAWPTAECRLVLA